VVLVSFPRVLERHVACPPVEVDAATVRQALERAFARLPAVRGYVLDEEGELRQHMAVFVDGMPVKDRRTLGDKLTARAEVQVMQALSGG